METQEKLSKRDLKGSNNSSGGQGEDEEDEEEEGAFATQSRLRLKFVVRDLEGVQGFWGPPNIEADQNMKYPPAIYMQWSRDGKYLGLIHSTEMCVYESESGSCVHKVAIEKGVALSFSPQSNYLVAFESLVPEKGKNLNLWNISSGELVQSWTQKAYSAETWPSLKFSDDESICGHLVSNQVDFYQTPNFSKIAQSLKLPNVSNYVLSSGTPIKVAAFVPEKKGTPACVRLYRYPQLDQHVSSKSFFKAQDCKMMWNSKGSALLVLTHTDVDKTGKSYYGETGLYFMSSDGKLDLNVTLKKEGPIHDVCWSPSGRFFIVIYGFMPSQTTIFDQKCQPVADIGQAARNTICWSYHDRLVCLGAFGNLKGGMEFWEPKKLKKIASAAADYSSSHEWAPNSHYIMAGTLYRRMKLDNEVKIWNYDGSLIYKQAYKELYQVSWRPSLPGVYPPPKFSELMKSAKEEKETPKQVVPAKYVPPHLVGKVSNTPTKKAESGPMKYSKQTQSSSKDQGPPGYDPEPTKKKNRKKKKKGDTESAEQEEAEEGAEEEEGGKKDISAKVVAASPPVENPEKKLKNLQKKLRQIDELKEKQAKGQVLDQDALDKISKEEQLRKELNELNLLDN